MTQARLCLGMGLCLALHCLPQYVCAKIKLQSKASLYTRLYTQSVCVPDRDRVSPVVLGGERAEVMLKGSQGGHTLPAGLTHPPHLHTHTQTLMTMASGTKGSFRPELLSTHVHKSRTHTHKRMHTCTYARSHAHRCLESFVSPLEPMHARGFSVRVHNQQKEKGHELISTQTRCTRSHVCSNQARRS